MISFTIAFTIEYLLRVWTVKQPLFYIRSFYGIVDLAALLPTYLSLFVVDAEYLIVIRMLRVMRVFRILKLIQYLEGSSMIMKALRASGPKITVFVMAVFTTWTPFVICFGISGRATTPTFEQQLHGQFIIP